MAQWVDATTIRGARAAGIACATLLALLLLASIWVPELIVPAPGVSPAGRMLIALVLGMPLSLALALRDPVRNAGVLAVVGLGCGFLAGTRVVNAVRGEEVAAWPMYAAGAAFLAVAVTLVVTYTRLRRPHPIVVRVVVVAVALMPFVLYLYDWASLQVRPVR